MIGTKKVVCFVLPSLTSGGAEHQTINQINYLVAQGDASRVRLLVLSNVCTLLDELNLDKKYIGIIQENSITTIQSRVYKKLPGLSRKAARFFRKQGVTDVIAILPMAHVVCRMTKVFLFSRVRLNTYYRDVYYQVSPLNTTGKYIFNKFNSLLAFLADKRTLFISQAVYQDISSNIFTRKPLILPNSLPGKKADASEGKVRLSELGLGGSDKYLILIPGRLHFKKGHVVFIRAFSKFLKGFGNLSPEVAVIIAGDGPERSAIEKEIENLGLEKYFTVIGTTRNSLLLSLYKCVNLVVIPSIYEGFGNVAIEGLMQESVMLVADTGGLAEIIRDGENGFLFPKGDDSGLASKLQWLYQRRGEKLLDGSELYKEFINKYTIETQMSKIVAFCEIN